MFIFLTEMKKMQKYAGETKFNMLMCVKYFQVCLLQSLEKPAVPTEVDVKVVFVVDLLLFFINLCFFPP